MPIFGIKGLGGVALKELLWAAASSYTDIEFRHHMEEIKKLNHAAFEYLEKIDPSGWSRSWFSDYPKCDLLVNNISECFNSYILKARDKPILTMLEMIRKQLQRRYQVKRDGIKTLKGKLCHRIVDKLEVIGEEATNYLSRYAGDDLFEVEQGRRTYVVDLRKRTCGCRKWEMTGIPCAYAHFAITFHGHKLEDYVDHCYSMRKFGLRGKCGYCKMLGHNSRTCPRKKQLASNYRQPATEVELPTPPPASVSLLPNRFTVIVDAYMVWNLWIAYLWHFFFFIMVGFRHRVKDAAVVSGGHKSSEEHKKGRCTAT
jgi:hypothetical protein